MVPTDILEKIDELGSTGIVDPRNSVYICVLLAGVMPQDWEIYNGYQIAVKNSLSSGELVKGDWSQAHPKGRKAYMMSSRLYHMREVNSKADFDARCDLGVNDLTL